MVDFWRYLASVYNGFAEVNVLFDKEIYRKSTYL